jgi:hypothetical protein
MELHQCTFHHIENWCTCDTDGFCQKKYKYRKIKMHFDNTIEKDSAPKQYTEKLVFEMVKNIELVFGKGTVKGQKRENSNSDRHTFQEAINFFQIPSLLKGPSNLSQH